MVKTLYDFYRTDEWETLIKVLRDERTRSDGYVYCEHCGERIVKAYDCIAHHTIELDESNMNDADIALNPKLIELVHHRCHNLMHNKLGCGERQVYLVYGSPCAGKTTYVKENMNPGDLIVDMDNIWQCITGLERYTKPGKLNGIAFGIRDALLDAVKTRKGCWSNAYVVGGYPLCGERERLCRTLGAREVFIDTAKEECIERLLSVEDGRNREEWKEYIEDWWRKYSPRSAT